MYTSRDIARMFDGIMSDVPCSYNDLDEMSWCDWCENNCGKVESIDCWEHAIESGWLDD